MSPDADYEYDVCFSFAGEQRAYVHAVAEEVRQQGVKVFFDEFERAPTMGQGSI